jgi:uncharacterized protein YndB with AHSA1/START domain
MVILWVVLGILIVFITIALLFLHFKGKSLPPEHTSFAVIQLNNTPEEVWSVIADASRQPEWFKGLKSVERLPDRNGRTVWKQTMGRNAFTLEETVCEPPRRLVREIADLKGPFSGSWEFLLIPVPSKDPARPASVKVRITERGKIDLPIARAVMAMFGEDMYLKKYLSALAKKFGQTATFSND